MDALMPKDMAAKAEQVGVAKAGLGIFRMLALGILAGAFIAMGALFATTVWAGLAGLPYGIQRLLGGLAFCTGLILVVVGGAELFTGNCLIPMAWANRKVTTRAMLRNWFWVYLGNFIGSMATAYLMFLSGQHLFGGGAVGLAALNIGIAKTSLGFVQAILLGLFCNALVCMAVWLCFSARSTADKILSIIFPVTAFVAAGFEHSIANMYFIPLALFIRADAAFVASVASMVKGNPANLTWTNFLLYNLLPVTLGNILGGAFLVGAMYWFIFLRRSWTGRGDVHGMPHPRPMTETQEESH